MSLLTRFYLSIVFMIGPLLRLSADELSAPGAEVDLQFFRFGSIHLDTSTARVSLTTESIDLSFPLAGSAWMGLEADLYGERQRYQFNDFSFFINGRASPLSQARDFELQPSFLLMPKGPWSVAVSPKLQYSNAQHASLEEGRLWSLSVATFYQSAGKLKLGIGLNASQRMQGSALILPFPVIDWQMSEHWALRALDGESGRLAYRAGAQLSFYGEMRFESRDIRLAGNSSIPSGVLRTEDFPVLIGAEYHVSQHISLQIAAGRALAETFRFEDRDGRLLRVSQIHSPFLTRIEADLTF